LVNEGLRETREARGVLRENEHIRARSLATPNRHGKAELALPRNPFRRHQHCACLRLSENLHSLRDDLATQERRRQHCGGSHRFQSCVRFGRIASVSPENRLRSGSRRSPQSEFAKKNFFRGWGWFAIPVVLNLLFLSIPTFDYNYTSKLTAYFSIPYLAIAAIIGIRRGSQITVSDFLFLAFGNLAIVTLLWHLNPPSHP
jgi:hypothetical protein